MHFELPVDDPERAIKFYSENFGWKFNKWDGGEQAYWLISTGDGPGIDGGMMVRNPGQPVTNTIEVADCDQACSKIEQSGGQIVVPKMTIPGVGYLAYFKDPDGNIFGVMHSDRSAQ
jgi:predicted enzyme related to lactoylglutathione lyase